MLTCVLGGQQMKLKKIIQGVEIVNDISKIYNEEIKMLSNKLDECYDGCVYFCYAGQQIDGHNMDLEHLKECAKALVVEHFIDIDIPQIVVKDSRQAMALMAQNFYETKDMCIIGITGTNGKTTNAFLIAHILKQSGKKVGIIGTQGIYFANQKLPAKLTTPDPIDLHEIISIMKKAGVTHIVMEVSAHAIALKKVEGINFIAKILTNITEDHLDFFETMENYSKTKLEFMKDAPIRIYPSDDAYAQNEILKSDDILTFGINNPSDAFSIEMSGDCSSYILNICDFVTNVNSHLYGLFNVYNVLSASLCALALGVDIKTIKIAIESFKGVEGRFNVIKLSDDIKIIVDFAHTPDGLENVLKTARNITTGKLVCLFGCGGNRDRQKRKIMGEVADKYADFIYVTSDNPRYENPIDIIEDIVCGIKSKNFLTNIDRAATISIAIKNLKPFDTLLVCGKGAENYIDIKGEKIPYSDFEQINKNIR